MPRTVCSNMGLAGSTSILRRSRLICTSTVRSLAAMPLPDKLLARNVVAGARAENGQDLAFTLGDAHALRRRAATRRGRSGTRRGRNG